MDMSQAAATGVFGFWGVFSFSFLVALTGALAPGPLLTYTIVQTAKTETRGYLTGVWVIFGHALLETIVIILIISGFSFLITDPRVVRGISLAGGGVLIFFGAGILRDVYTKKIQAPFFRDPETQETSHPNQTQELQKTDDSSSAFQDNRGSGITGTMKEKLDNPVLGGIFISMSNPYWWVWWATIGLAFMVQFDISYKNYGKLLAFFLGHEAGDLAWYFLVSLFTFFGLRHINKKIYLGILSVCGLFMIGFGIYLAASPPGG